MKSIKCVKCGRETLYENDIPRYCAHCAGELRAPGADENGAKRAFLDKAHMEDDYPRRYSILLEAREQFPNDIDIEREILYLGRLHERGGKPDFYRIPYWPLSALENPSEYSQKDRQKMLLSFFRNPELERVMSLAGDKDAFFEEYMLHMAREYVSMFMKCASSNSMLFGFRRKQGEVMKRCAACMARMLQNAETSELVPEDKRKTVVKSLWHGFILEFPDLPAEETLASAAEGRVKYRH